MFFLFLGSLKSHSLKKNYLTLLYYDYPAFFLMKIPGFPSHLTHLDQTPSHSHSHMSQQSLCLPRERISARRLSSVSTTYRTLPSEGEDKKVAFYPGRVPRTTFNETTCMPAWQIPPAWHCLGTLPYIYVRAPLQSGMKSIASNLPNGCHSKRFQQSVQTQA
jgi:hypothetical protein